MLITFMNARRRGEVIHKKVGLMRGALQVHSEKMKIYEVAFYILKTYKKKIPFYVNETTCLAIRSLEVIQTCYSRIDTALGHSDALTSLEDIPLFSYRRFSVAECVGATLKFFGFSDYARDQDNPTNIIIEAGGDRGLMFTDTHVFRRMYCLVAFYRYENRDIMAISWQICHMDLKSVRTYLTDPMSRKDVETIYAKMPTEAEDRRRAFIAEDADLEREMTRVGNLKMAEEIDEIISGEKYTGGFAKYIRKIHARFSKVVSFETDNLVESVYHAIKRRGHFPRPYSHGECMLGSVGNRKAARCYSMADDRHHFEDASPSKCGGCRFHLTKVAYVENLRLEASALRREIEEGGLDGFALARKKRDLKALETSIASLCERLEIENEG
ncbi:hypothetical protein CI15_07600 [Paraburkholderia monticola]|uniref:Uncharacterized protein n=1 Tax=Paraburkholderia monticola TaxID=1399968 RepID=A0A149PYJ2_9BURK|nr:hypothetical protein CI15_07600 [Paraburkholderia monticola]